MEPNEFVVGLVAEISEVCGPLKPAELSCPTVANPDDEGLFFCHVPKTAGTSLRLMIERTWRSRHFPKTTMPNDFDAQEDQMIAQTDIAFGHYGHRQLDRLRCLSKRHWVLATMLRSPREQAISHYRYVLRTPDHVWHPAIVGETFAQVLNLPSLGIDLANCQTRCLHEIVDPVSVPVDSLEPRTILDQIALVGVTDFMGAFYLRLCLRFCRTPLSELLSENVDPTRNANRDYVPELAVEEESQLYEMSFLDRSLFELGFRRAELDAIDLIAQLNLTGAQPADLSTQEGFSAGAAAVRDLLARS